MMQSFGFVFGAVCLAAAFASNAMNDLAAKEKYCAVDPNHTACKYRALNETKACGKVVRRGVSSGERLLLLGLINEKRRGVARGSRAPQPAASNMNALVWNSEAASIAQLWADQCTPGADQARHTVLGAAPIANGQNRFFRIDRTRAGHSLDENLADMASDEGSTSESDSVENGMESHRDGGFSIRTAVEAWFSEISKFAAASVGSYTPDPKTGNYTQLMWAETGAVGCGYILQSNKHHLVCNFVAAGNIAGKSVYKTGTPCSACPTALPRCVGGGLCAK